MIRIVHDRNRQFIHYDRTVLTVSGIPHKYDLITDISVPVHHVTFNIVNISIPGQLFSFPHGRLKFRPVNIFIFDFFRKFIAELQKINKGLRAKAASPLVPINIFLHGTEHDPREHVLPACNTHSSIVAETAFFDHVLDLGCCNSFCITEILLLSDQADHIESR